MRICGIDIGAKNLSICLFDAELPDIKTCNNCKRRATKKNTSGYFCTIHAKKETDTKDLPKRGMPIINNIVKWEIVNLVQEEMKEVENRKCTHEGCKNKPSRQTKKDKQYYCAKHAKTLTTEHTTMKKRVVTYDLALYTKRIQNYFDLHKNTFLPCDLVVIENQGVLNLQCKDLQVVIFTWFIFNDARVSLVSASSKLKVYSGDDREELDLKGTKKDPYKTRKTQSILHTRAMLKDKPDAIQKLDDHPTKIDDLCDSFLLGCYGTFLVSK